MKDSRYQFQPWPIKAYRWLRWRPYYALRAYLSLAWWFCRGAHILDQWLPYLPTRRAYAEHILAMSRSFAAMKMQDFSTTEELLGSLRTPVESKEQVGHG